MLHGPRIHSTQKCVCVCIIRRLLYAPTAEVPDCVIPSEPVIIKWNVDPERNYEYSITDSSGAVVRSKFFANFGT